MLAITLLGFVSSALPLRKEKNENIALGNPYSHTVSTTN